MAVESAGLPGGIGISHVRVYDGPTIDGCAGGTPHLHLACAEAYLVVRGQGLVQTLSFSGYQEHDLRPGELVWFTPDVIHRLVNLDGKLELFVLMQNAGLPEAGDLTITFPSEVLESPESYAAAADVLDGGDPLARVAQRRDLAVGGFLHLKERVLAGDYAPLTRFRQQAEARVSGLLPAWRERVEQGPLAQVNDTLRRLDELGAPGSSEPGAGSVRRLPAPGEQRGYGCCGLLGTYP